MGKWILALALIWASTSAMAQEPGSDITDDEIDSAIATFVESGYAGHRVADPNIVNVYDESRSKIASALEDLEQINVGRGSKVSRRDVVAQKMQLEIMDQIIQKLRDAQTKTTIKWHLDYEVITKHRPVDGGFCRFAPLRIVDVIDAEFVHAMTTVNGDKNVRVAVRLWPESGRYNDQVIDVSGRVFMAAGTYTYPTVTGGANTIPHFIECTARIDAYVAKEIPPEDRQPQGLTAISGISREWKSHDRKFSVDAEIVGFNGTQVTLKKSDGSEVKVKSSLLSVADRIWLGAYESAVGSIKSNGDVVIKEIATGSGGGSFGFESSDGGY